MHGSLDNPRLEMYFLLEIRPFSSRHVRSQGAPPEFPIAQDFSSLMNDGGLLQCILGGGGCFHTAVLRDVNNSRPSQAVSTWYIRFTCWPTWPTFSTNKPSIALEASRQQVQEVGSNAIAMAMCSANNQEVISLDPGVGTWYSSGNTHTHTHGSQSECNSILQQRIPHISWLQDGTVWVVQSIVAIPGQEWR